jgi:chaperonin GroES
MSITVPKANFTLLHDLVMVFPIPKPTTTASGLVIPDVVDKNSTAPVDGVVLTVGPGKVDKKGNLVPLPVKAGDRIIFVRQSAREISVNKDTFLVIPISEVLCKVGVNEATAQ